MASYNKVILVGNLTRDPETKTLPSGDLVAAFGLATNRTYTAKDGTKKEDVCFIDVSVYGKQAGPVAEHLKKGRQVLVDGRLHYRTWEAQDGTKHSKHEVVADRVTFLGPKPDGNGGTTKPATEEEVPF
jgi:single-strand DNA-binding protein